MTQFSAYRDNCVLLDTFGWIIQGLLGGLAFSSLIYKRYHDPYRRPWVIWFMDVSKQAIGSLSLHCYNILAAEVMSKINECRWYLMNILIDLLCIAGVSFILLRGLETIFSNIQNLSFRSGNYGGKNKWGAWFYQLVIWLGIVFVAKCVAVSILLVFFNSFDTIGGFLLYPFKNSPHLELITVMIIVPLLVNVIQLWIIDAYLKRPDREAFMEAAIGRELKRRGSMEDEINKGSTSMDDVKYTSHMEFSTGSPTAHEQINLSEDDQEVVDLEKDSIPHGYHKIDAELHNIVNHQLEVEIEDG